MGARHEETRLHPTQRRRRGVRYLDRFLTPAMAFTMVDTGRFHSLFIEQIASPLPSLSK